MTTATAGSAYALLADGTTVEIRPARPGDYAAVRAMHEAMSPDNTYLRFFNMSRLSAEREAERVCEPDAPARAALLAVRGAEVVGVATFDVISPGDAAEIAFAVADHMHGQGIATLLLEHLVSLARNRRIRAFTAVTLVANDAMLKVFTDAGLPVQRRIAGGEIELTIPIPESDAGEQGQQLDSYCRPWPGGKAGPTWRACVTCCSRPR